jgi:hypothetical protein
MGSAASGVMEKWEAFLAIYPYRDPVFVPASHATGANGFEPARNP